MSDAGFEVGESFARILTETTQSLVCVLDETGRILLFNEACERATGFTRDEVLGRDAREFVIPPEERDAFGEFLAYVAKTGSSMPQVGHWMTKDGERRLIAWSNKPMAGTEGGPMSLVTTGIDLTDRSPLRSEDERALAGDPEAKLAEVGRLATEQRALRRVATLVASEAQPERVFAAVSDECARVLEVNASAVFRYDADGAATVVGRHDRDNIDVFPIGMRVVDPHSSVGRVRTTGEPVRIDDWGGITGPTAEAMYRTGYRSTAAVPIVVAGTLWGAVGIASENPLPPETEHRLAAFCELISLALASAQARADLVASRLRLVRAGDETRRRLERNLHDGAQQRLVSVALTLRLARARLTPDNEQSSALLEEAARELDTGLQELREIARGLHPAILTDRGLLQALETLAARVPVPLEIHGPEERLPAHIEATIYYIVAEALTNVARHADATQASVTIRRDADMVRCEVTDDGRGGADISRGTGILGLRDRAEAAGGTLTLTSPPGEGTTVAAALPLAR
ncbi:MAG TPA: PAS domain S-box protein [Solirubrobacteraceae bacterium]|nr:PAS domain S-box protein [Solirubrobacteraceae bacterium]